MVFLVPKPVERKVRTKSQQNCDKNTDNSSIFDKIRKLCRIPNPVIDRLDERLFVSSIFDDIRELCRRPELLTGIEDHLIEEKEQESTESVVPLKVFQKRKIERYSDSSESNSFDIISKSKIFATLVKGRPNQRTDHLRGENVVTKPTNCENNKTSKKRSTVKCPKNERKYVRTRRPLLTIDCDLTSKITEYSKQYSKANNRTKSRKSVKKLEPINGSDDVNSSSESPDSGICSSYESIASPMSTCITLSYSMPATPSSSVDSQSSCMSCETTSSVLSQIRKSLNPKFETYRQYIQRCSQKELQHQRGRKGSKQGLHYKEKVLQWSDKICSGNITPVHNIEYLATPPGSPQKTESNVSPSDELNAMIESLENIETNDLFNAQFNEILNSLLTDDPLSQAISETLI